MFLGYVLYTGGVWTGDMMVADIAEMEEMNATELHVRRLNAKEVLTLMKGDNFIFPVADGTVKVSGGEQRLRTCTLIWDRAEGGEEQEVLRGESDELSFPTSRWLNTRRWFLVYHKRFHLSPSTVRAERRIISFSVEVHRRYQNNTNVTGCTLGETYRRLLERGWRKRSVRCMDRFHKVHFIERKATWRICMVRGETNEESNDLKTRQCLARYVEIYVWCKKKQNKDELSRNQSSTMPVNWEEYSYWDKRWRNQAHNQSRS